MEKVVVARLGGGIATKENPKFLLDDKVLQKRPSVIIEVEEGRVSNVYSPDPELNVDILNLDATDVEVEEDLVWRHHELLEKCENGELYSLL